MDWSHYYVLALAAATIVLLALEKAHLSVIGVALMVAVAVPGLVTPEQAIEGFAKPALITIACLFVVGEGFVRTGAASILAERVLQRTGSSESAVILLVMVMSAFLSAFVNNTLVVITFMPVITTICGKTGLFPSRLLIPLSYASILGGMCTLVGTSTNLLVSGELLDHDEMALEMFTITPAGVILAGIGILYLAVIGRRLLPKVPSLSMQMSHGPVKEYVTEITIGEGSKLIGQPIQEVGKRGSEGAATMMLVRNEATVWPPFRDLSVQQGDILMMSGSIQELTQLQLSEARGTKDNPDTYDPSTMSFFELAISPVSTWVGKRVGQVALKSQYGAAVVALQRSGRHIRERVSSLTLHAGDVLLAFGDDRSKAYLRQSDDFHMIEGVDQTIHRTEKAPWAFAIILVVIALFVTNAVHYSTAAMIGALGMIMAGCLTVRQAHSAVRWPIIFFIAGMLGLSKSLDTTGTTDVLGAWLLSLVPGESPYLLLIATFAGTVLLTEFLSNNAVAVLMVPVALSAAQQAKFDPSPFVMAVALGASSCFANPIGYQTNLMVLGPGGYRFRNFLKVGLPLDLLMIVAGVVVIPWFWPLQAPTPRTGWVDAHDKPVHSMTGTTSQNTELTLTLKLREPGHVYISSYSIDQGHLALYPSQFLSNDLTIEGALPPGRYRLPGTLAGQALGWPVPLEGVVTYMVVVSREPLPDVLAWLGRLDQVGNQAVDRSMGHYQSHAIRKNGDLAPSKGEKPPGALLAAFKDASGTESAMIPWPGREGVYYSKLMLEVR